MKKKITIFAAISLAAPTLFLIGIQANADGSGNNALGGTWLVRLDPGTPGLAEFDELMTFTPGGGIVESNNFPFFALGLATPGPGQGNWRFTGRQTFEFTFVKFLYAPNGAAAGTLKAVGTINYSPGTDTWSGPANVLICDNQASNCNQIDVTEGTATRITAGS